MSNQNHNNTPYMPFKGMLFMVIFGAVMIAAGAGIFFGYCRPFTEFVYYECKIRNKDFFPIDDDHVRVVSYVEDMQYEKILTVNSGIGGWTSVAFYYNKTDPTDTVYANRDALMWAMPITAGLGIFIIVISVLQYRKFTKSKIQDGGENAK
jgi:hypothetical protein